MFHSVFNSLARSRYLLIPLFAFFQFYSMVRRDSKVHNFSSSLFFVNYNMAWPRLGDPFVSQKSQRSLCFSFSRTDSGLCIYHLFLWSNFNFLHNSQWITLPTQSCLVLYSFWPDLLHCLLYDRSFCLRHHITYICFVLSILALIWLVLIALFCAAIRRDSVSLLRFPFLCHVHVFLCEMSIVSRLKHP